MKLGLIKMWPDLVVERLFPEGTIIHNVSYGHDNEQILSTVSHPSIEVLKDSHITVCEQQKEIKRWFE